MCVLIFPCVLNVEIFTKRIRLCFPLYFDVIFHYILLTAMRGLSPHALMLQLGKHSKLLPTHHHKLFYKFQDTHAVQSQYIIYTKLKPEGKGLDQSRTLNSYSTTTTHHHKPFYKIQDTQAVHSQYITIVTTMVDSSHNVC